MLIKIKETGKIEQLNIFDRNDTDWIFDFIGNTGALTDEQQFVEEGDEIADYVCDQETFYWWERVVDQTQKLTNRIDNLREDLVAEKFDALIDFIQSGYECDLEYQADHVNALIDEFLENNVSE